MSLFVDSSAWFAASVKRDRNNERAKAILEGGGPLVTTDQVLVETWLLLNNRFRHAVAESFWRQIRSSAVRMEFVTPADMETAWSIGAEYPDQTFSIVERTSFAVMNRLKLTRAASFDDDFAIYRFGRSRQNAFEVLR